VKVTYGGRVIGSKRLTAKDSYPSIELPGNFWGGDTSIELVVTVEGKNGAAIMLKNSSRPPRLIVKE